MDALLADRIEILHALPGILHCCRVTVKEYFSAAGSMFCFHTRSSPPREQ